MDPKQEIRDPVFDSPTNWYFEEISAEEEPDCYDDPWEDD